MREPPRASTVRTYLGTFGIAWLTMAALMLVTANEAAVPVDFLVRPALVALLPAAVIALAATPLGPARHPAAAALSAVVLLPALWVVPAALVGIELGVWAWQRRSARSRLVVGRFTVVTVAVIAALGAVRLAPQLTDYIPVATGSNGAAAQPVYLLLLDGYPRIDSLRELGIDNTAFIEQLESRGFDHYPDATSGHQWTHRTLQAMIAGDANGIPDVPGTTAEEQSIRAALNLPDGWLAIDPPASHVVMRGGTNASAGGMNDFEIRLVGASALGLVARDPAASIIAGSLRSHFERSLRLLVESPARRTFAHVLLPHPPFIYADGISDCWPRCNIFDVSTEKLQISRTEWAEQMDVQVDEVNGRVLAAVDAILGEHPDAVIVLFSDHGGRLDVESDEVYRSLLVARTPGHAGLFSAEPHPHAILRLVAEAYP
jgi:hypothetical protein